MKKILTLISLLMLIFQVNILAQNQQITGNVTMADDGSSFPGVTVRVKGLSIGTVTDMEGNYSISVPPGATHLVFSFVGMKTMEVEIGTQTLINASLETDVLGLDEVVVVAYGVQRREAKTGSVAVLKSDEIESIPVTSADKLLQGKVAGVQINNGSGMPGSNTTITIRGAGSINADTDPLFVVDGVPVISLYFVILLKLA